MFLDPKFWLSISFLIFLALALKYIMPKIIGAIDNKSKQIADEIQQAKLMKEEAEKLLLEAKKYHQESLLYCQKLIVDTKKEADKLLADSKNSVTEEIVKRTNLAKERIKQEEEKIIREVKLSIVAAALKIIEEKSQTIPKQSSLEMVKAATKDISKMVH